MRCKSIGYILIVFLFFSCGYGGDKVDFFQNINLNEKADWLFVHADDDMDTCAVIADIETLIKLQGDLKLKATSACGGTTPDYSVSLFKNGKRVQLFTYCSWEPFSYDLGRLEGTTVSARLKYVTVHSIAEHDALLDSLKQLKNSYILYPKDTVIAFPDQLKFEVKVVDKGQDMFEQEEILEKEFQQLFKNGRYKVEAEWSSSEVGTPKKLGYHLIVDCDSSFLKQYNHSRLQNSQLFSERSEYRYSNKEFTIYYYEWNK